jgi:acyl carrier protein
MAIEDEFSFYAKDEEAENVRTVKDVYDLVFKLLWRSTTW